MQLFLFNIMVALICSIIVFGVYYIFAKNIPEKKYISVISAITIVIAIKLSNAFIVPYYEAWQFESKIKEIKLFNTISIKHPTEFGIFLEKSKKDIINKKYPIFEQQYSMELVQSVFFKHLKHASDQDINLYLNSILNLYQYLVEKNPVLVSRIENEEPIYANNMNDKKITELFNALLQSQEIIIKNSDKNLQKIPTEDEVENELKPIIDNLFNRYGRDNTVALLSGKLDNVEPRKTALMIIELYKGIVESGQKAAGQILRFISSKR